MQVAPVVEGGEGEGVEDLVPHKFKVTWMHAEGEEEPQERTSVRVFVFPCWIQAACDFSVVVGPRCAFLTWRWCCCC